MKTIAQHMYSSIDEEGDIKNQAENWCANNEHLVESFENVGIATNVVFIDGSGISFDEYSVAIGGQ
jgi:hypothetical protein